jgi:hypothetical protein
LIQANYTYDAGRRLLSEKIDTANLRGKVKEYAYTGWNQLATPPQAGFMHAVVRNTVTHNTALSNSIPKTEPRAEQGILDQAGRITSDAQYRYSYNVWGKLASVQNKTNNQTIASYQQKIKGSASLIFE